METYILQFGLDRDSQNFVQNIRNEIKLAGFVDRQRGWLPHITIDKYNDSNFNLLINNVESVLKNFSAFDIELKQLGNFDNETLFIDPLPKNTILDIKTQLDLALDEFRFESRKLRPYNPHITLCTNNNLDECQKVATKNLSPKTATVEKIWLYTEKNMELIKEWTL